MRLDCGVILQHFVLIPGIAASSSLGSDEVLAIYFFIASTCPAYDVTNFFH